MNSLFLVVAIGLGVAGQLPPGFAPPTAEAPSADAARTASSVSGPCGSPRTAVATWLSNLMPDRVNKAKAATCTLAPAGMSEREVGDAVVKLKRVLDARGIYVRLENLPDDPEYRDPSTGVQRVQITNHIPELDVVFANGAWRLSPTALSAADGLFRETFPLNLDRIVESLPEWTSVPVFGVAPWQVAALLLLFFVGWLARLVVSNIIASQLKRVMVRLRVEWGEKLTTSASLPLGNLVFAGVLALGVPSLQLTVTLAAIALLAVRVLAAVSVVMLVYRAIDLLAAYLAARAEKTATKLDDQLVPIAMRSLKAATLVIGIIFVLQNLDIDVTSLLTGLGLGGLAFALAAKDVVGNFFGSVTIFLDKPFQIGDWVQTSGVEGIVEEVGIRSTRIRTFYNSLVTIPNGKFTDAVVDNYGMRVYRRCFTTLGLTYDTTPEQMEAFCDGVRGIIKAHPATRKDYYEVHFSGYGDFSLNVMLYFFFKVPSWSDELRARHEVFLDIWRLAEHLGVSFAFPTRTLHIDSQAEPAAMEPRRRPDKETLKETVDAFGPGGADVVAPGPRIHPGFYAGR